MIIGLNSNTIYNMAKSKAMSGKKHTSFSWMMINWGVVHRKQSSLNSRIVSNMEKSLTYNPQKNKNKAIIRPNLKK